MEPSECVTEHLGHLCHLTVMHDRLQNAECQLAFRSCKQAPSISLLLLSSVDTECQRKKVILCILKDNLKPNITMYCYKDQLNVQGKIMC